MVVAHSSSGVCASRLVSSRKDALKVDFLMISAARSHNGAFFFPSPFLHPSDSDFLKMLNLIKSASFCVCGYLQIYLYLHDALDIEKKTMPREGASP